jgi:hypothetical protein
MDRGLPGVEASMKLASNNSVPTSRRGRSPFHDAGFTTPTLRPIAAIPAVAAVGRSAIEHFVIMKRVVLSVFLIAAACIGCQTHHSSQRLKSAASTVLAAHHFAPARFVTGPDGVIWAVASRPRSPSAVQTACIKLNSDGRASAEVTRYQYVGSDWATVGRLFDQGRSHLEAAEIETSIEQSLKAR